MKNISFLNIEAMRITHSNLFKFIYLMFFIHIQYLVLRKYYINTYLA